MFYVIFVLLLAIWPKTKIIKRKERDKMKENDCFFYREIDNKDECMIFKGICDESRLNKCESYQMKTTSHPNGFEYYITMANAINQARFIKSQKFHNKLIIGLSVILAIISSIALLKSFNVF